MAEDVKVLTDTVPAIIIWNLMCAHAKKLGDETDLMVAFPGLVAEGDDTKVTAELIVNGVSLPVMDSLKEYWRKSEERLDQRARNMAAEILKGSKLQAVTDLLMSIEWEIHNELDKLFPGTRQEDR